MPRHRYRSAYTTPQEGAGAQRGELRGPPIQPVLPASRLRASVSTPEAPIRDPGVSRNTASGCRFRSCLSRLDRPAAKQGNAIAAALGRKDVSLLDEKA